MSQLSLYYLTLKDVTVSGSVQILPVSGRILAPWSLPPGVMPVNMLLQVKGTFQILLLLPISWL